MVPVGIVLHEAEDNEQDKLNITATRAVAKRNHYL